MARRYGALIGTGNTATVYMLGDKAVKIFHRHIHRSYVEQEYEISHIIRQSGLTVPKVYELLEIEGRDAILFEKINGESLKTKWMKNPIQLVSDMKKMVELHTDMHQVSKLPLPSQKNKLMRDIASVDMFTVTEKQEIQQYLTQLPEGKQLCHGDFHPDNILICDDGPVIIDWNDAVSGHPMADAARTYLLFMYGGLTEQTSMIQRIVRCLLATLYLRFYKDQNGLSKDLIMQYILPVAAARLSENLVDFEKRQLLKIVHKKRKEYRS